MPISEYKPAAHTTFIQQAFECLPNSIYIIEPNAMRFVHANQTALKTLGYTREELLNKTPQDIDACFSNEMMTATFDKLINGKEQHTTFSAIHRRKDGSGMDVEVHLQCFQDNDHSFILMSATNASVSKTAEEDNRLKAHLLNTVGQSVIATDLTGVITYWNKAAADIFGWSESEAIGKNVVELVPSQQSRRQGMQIMQSLIKGETWSGEFEVQRKNGAVFTALICNVPICNEQGNVTGIIGVSTDITKQKLIEQALSLSEKNYRLLFEESPIPLWMTDKTTYNFIEVNQAAIEQYGYTREEFIRMNARDIKLSEEHYFLDILTKENKNKSREFFEEIARHKKKNGDVIYVKINAGLIIYNGRAVWLAAGRDITQELLHSRQLKQSQQQLSLIFNSTDNGMWLLQVEQPGNALRLLAANEAFAAFGGYNKAALAGRLLNEMYDMQKYQHIVVKYKECIVSKTTQKFTSKEYIGGEEKDFDITLIPIKDEDGNVTQLLGISTDTTEQQKAKDKLVVTNRQLRELAAHLQDIREEERTSMAREIHDELGQQLTALKMDISWLGRKLNREEEHIRTKIQTAISLADATIHSVRKIASQLRPGMLDDLGLAEAMEWQSGEFSSRTGIEVECVMKVLNIKFPPTVSIAIFRIYQEALTNITRHAQATKVECSLIQKNDWLCLTVADNGKGFNTDTETEIKTLGLLGMKERVIMLNGHYHIQSEPGKGTMIAVEIPFVK